MSQKIQTKLNDSAHICQVSNHQLTPCGYHDSRVYCEFSGITDDLLDSNSDRFHSFMPPSKGATELAKLFCANYPPAGSWYLVKEQRLWFKESLKQRLIAHTADAPFQLLIAGVASYVHALGQLLICAQAQRELQLSFKIQVTFSDRCSFPLEQIRAFLKAAEATPFFRYSFEVEDKKFKCPKALDKLVRDFHKELNDISVQYQLGDLTDSSLFPNEQFDLVSEHFMTSLLYKNFEIIKPIRANYSAWLKSGGWLFSADGIRADSEVYTDFAALNADVGLVLDESSTTPVWDPYGLPQEVFQAILDSAGAKRYPVENDNTMSGFVKQ